MGGYSAEEFFSAERNVRGPRQKGNVVYMEITKDRYELPIAVADSVTELARLRCVDVSVISRALTRRVDPRRRHKYIKVELIEDELKEADDAADHG